MAAMFPFSPSLLPPDLPCRRKSTAPRIYGAHCWRSLSSSLAPTRCRGGAMAGGAAGRGENGSSCDECREAGHRSLLNWYLKFLEAYPMLTSSVITVFLNILGDLICQLLVEQVAILDFKRLAVVALLGAGLVGPSLHFWFNYLNRLRLFGSSATYLRLFIDQFLFAPVFIGVFFCALATLEGRSSQATILMLQQEWFSSTIANWQIWIPFQFLNFRFIPQQHQVLAANLMAVAWNVLLSYKTHKIVILK